MDDRAAGPIVGLRVLDLTTTPDAVSASTFLADLGADVVVVELDDGGHPARRVGPLVGGVSLLWKAMGRNKRCVRLPPGARQEVLDDLLARADVVVVDPGSRHGGVAAAAELSAQHPRAVVLSVSPFGATGVRASLPGTGRVAEAFGGQVNASGEPARAPLHSGFPIGASATALLGALGVMAAVLEREQSGRGQLVDLAGCEAVLRVMEFLPVFFQQTGFLNERSGGGSAYQVPVATWRTADDKWVTFTGNTNDVVHRLYRAMGRPELVEHPHFATNDGRVAHRDEVESTLADWARSLTRADLEQACEEHAVPVGSVFSMADIFEDACYRERASIVAVTDDDLGEARVPTVVPRLSRTPGHVRALGGPALAVGTADELWPAGAVAGVAGQRRAVDGRAGALAGLRVLDIGQILAGPYAATLLADLGADVVKVEKRDGGDDFRRQAPLHQGVSLWWKASARNKRSIALDLKDDADRATFLALVAHADVITANFVPGTLERLGFGYDDLAAVNPALVMVSVSGYGQDGPFRTRRAFGRNAEAFGGLAQVTGYADGPPLPTGCPVADTFSAILGAFAGLCALYARARDPQRRGQLVDVALYETVFRLLELTALVYDQLGIDAGHAETGTATGEICCVARTRDGHWVSASGWGTGPVVFGPDAPDGVDAPERATALDSLRRHIASSTLADVVVAPSPVDGIVCAPVMRIDELVADPGVAARAGVVTVADDELGEVTVAAVTPRLARTPGTVRHAAPRLDADRDAVLAGWREPPR